MAVKTFATMGTKVPRLLKDRGPKPMAGRGSYGAKPVQRSRHERRYGVNPTSRNNYR